MRLYEKLVLFMLAAAVGPVAVVGFSLLRGAERELEARIAAQQATAARASAEAVSREVQHSVEALARAAESIRRWPELSEAERQGALALLYRQSPAFTIVGLVDPEGGELARLVYLAAAEGDAPDGHPRVAPEDLGLFRAALPLAPLLQAGLGAEAMSPAYGRSARPFAATAAAIAVEGEQGRPWFVVAEIALLDAQRTARQVSAQGAGDLFLLDEEGRVLAGPDEHSLLGKAPEADVALGAAAREGERPGRYVIEGQAMLATAAPVPGPYRWTVVIRLPEQRAFAPVARMRRTVLAWMGGAIAALLFLGYLFTRRIGRHLETVVEGANAYARGELSHRIPVRGSDELSHLSSTFNAMGEELLAARARLERWNQELQQKVEERTADLKRAQAQLLETQKLAAIGQLGAGVAHEINNPLAGVLGYAQILLLEAKEGDPHFEPLKKIEESAKRARDITMRLLRFSQQRETPDFQEIDANAVVRDTLSLTERQIHDDGIELCCELDASCPKVRGDSGHLSQVLLNLVANARTAMKERPAKRLRLATRAQDGKLLLEVEDTGKGISAENLGRVFEPFFTTKDVWTNVGLGLSVAYRIVAEHGGRIEARSELGRGSLFTVEIPLLPAG